MLNNLKTEIKARRKQFDSTPNFEGKEKLSSKSDELFSSHSLLTSNKIWTENHVYSVLLLLAVFKSFQSNTK